MSRDLDLHQNVAQSLYLPSLQVCRLSLPRNKPEGEIVDLSGFCRSRSSTEWRKSGNRSVLDSPEEAMTAACCWTTSLCLGDGGSAAAAPCPSTRTCSSPPAPVPPRCSDQPSLWSPPKFSRFPQRSEWRVLGPGAALLLSGPVRLRSPSVSPPPPSLQQRYCFCPCPCLSAFFSLQFWRYPDLKWRRNLASFRSAAKTYVLSVWQLGLVWGLPQRTCWLMSRTLRNKRRVGKQT